MKIYSFYNNKGGVGKTTTCTQFAQNLSNKKKKILIIDLDPQGNTTSKFTHNRDELEDTMHDLLLNPATSVHDCIVNYSDYIDIIGNTLTLQNANNEMLLRSSVKAPTSRLKNKIINSNLHEIYDYILIDCPPSTDLLVSNALSITDEVIIPIMADGYSILGIQMLIEHIKTIQLEFNPKLKIGGVFLNNYRNTKLHNTIYEQFKEYFPEMCTTKIKQYVKLQENTHESQLLPSNYSTKDILKNYDNLINEITNA